MQLQHYGSRHTAFRSAVDCFALPSLHAHAYHQKCSKFLLPLPQTTPSSIFDAQTRQPNGSQKNAMQTMQYMLQHGQEWTMHMLAVSMHTLAAVGWRGPTSQHMRQVLMVRIVFNMPSVPKYTRCMPSECGRPRNKQVTDFAPK